MMNAQVYPTCISGTAVLNGLAHYAYCQPLRWPLEDYLWQQPSAQAELITGADGLTILPIDLQHFFTADCPTFLVSQLGDQFQAGGVKDVAGRRISQTAINAERDPAGLVTDGQTGHQFRRHHCGIVDVHVTVGSVGHPEFRFIGCEADAVTGTSMPFDFSLFEAFYFDTMQFATGRQITHFKPQALVNADEHKRPGTIHRKRSDVVAEGATRLGNGVVRRFGNRQYWRPQSSKVCIASADATNGVVRRGIGFDAGNHGARHGIYNVPMPLFQ